MTHITAVRSAFAASFLALAAGFGIELGPEPQAASAQADNLGLLTPQNSTLVLIDHQPQMIFGVRSHDRQAIRNNVTALAKAAKTFEVPTVLTTVAAETFSGPLIPEIKAVFPQNEGLRPYEHELVGRRARRQGRR